MIDEIDQAWRRLELRHLVALDAVVAAGSFRGAARQLDYTQSAISAQIASLEAIAGARLIDRPARGQRLRATEAGETLLAHAEQIGARVGALRADLEGIRSTRTLLRIGIYQSVATHLLPPLLRDLSATHPEIDLRLAEAGDDGILLRQLERGDLDLSFAALPLEPGPFTAHELLSEPYLLVVAADAPYPPGSSVPLAELDRLPLIDYRSVRSVHLTRTKLRALGGSPRIVFRSDENGTIHALVAAGVGVAVLPALSVDPNAGDVRTLSLDPSLPPRRLALVHHRDRPPSQAAEVVIGKVRAIARRT